MFSHLSPIIFSLLSNATKIDFNDEATRSSSPSPVSSPPPLPLPRYSCDIYDYLVSITVEKMRTCARARATGRPQSGALNYSSRARRDLRRPSSYKIALVKILGLLPLPPPPRRAYNIVIRDGRKRASSDKMDKTKG